MQNQRAFCVLDPKTSALNIRENLKCPDVLQHTFKVWEREREAVPAQLTVRSSGFASYIITSSNPADTRWGRYCAFSHSWIKMVRCRRRSGQAQVHRSPG